MRSLLLLLILLGLILNFGCAAEQPVGENDEVLTEDPAIEEKPGAEDEEALPAGPTMGLVDAPLEVDGSSEGYPTEPFEVAGALVHLAHDGEDLYLHLSVEGEGWVSVGFNQSGGGMSGANMIVGFIDQGLPALREDVGQGHRHSEADSSAVREHFLLFEDGMVVLEFSYPLVFPAGEGYNLDGLIPGEVYTLIYGANNDSGDISRKHTVRGAANFVVAD